MPARTALPLLLLVLTWTLPAGVHCQTIKPDPVSTQYVEVTWTRELLWFDVTEFEVVVSSEGSADCHESVSCSTPTCSFNSSACGLYHPCTPINITVSGGGYNYTAPALVLVTGPESVTNMTLRLEEGVQYISWASPSNDSSPCYKQTAVRISFNNKTSTDYFGHGIERTSKALCKSGYGTVEVWAEGGDGHSGSSSGTIVYTGSDVVDLVTFGTCEIAGCTSFAVNWSYVRKCPDVAYFSITLTDVTWELQDRSTPDFSFDVPINATSMTVTGLGYDSYYYTCIVAKDKDGEELADACRSMCRTDYVVPQNLTLQPLGTSTLRATWEPPVCQPETSIEYRLSTSYSYFAVYYTSDTTYDIDIYSFNLYEVQLGVYGHSRFNNESDTLTAEEYIKLGAPTVWSRSIHRSYLEVIWYHGIYNEHIYYMVTWGKDLQFYGETKELSFVIEGHKNIEEVVRVCVTAAFRGRDDLTSQTDCDPVIDYRLEDWEIALIAVVACLLAVVIGVPIALKIKKSKTQSRQRQQHHHHQQQHQHHHQQQHQHHHQQQHQHHHQQQHQHHHQQQHQHHHQQQHQHHHQQQHQREQDEPPPYNQREQDEPPPYIHANDTTGTYL